MNIRVLLILAAFVATVALFTGTASATSVTLVNPFFQDPTPTTTWTGDPAPYDSVADGEQTTWPTGWVPVNGTDDLNMVVERNPTSAEFTGADGNGALPSPKGIVSVTLGPLGAVTSTTTTLYGGATPAPTLGSQALFNASTFDNDCAIIADPAINGVVIQKNLTYTLTIAIGQGKTNPLAWYPGFSLLVADMGVLVNGNWTGHQGEVLMQEFHDTAQDVPDPDSFYDYSVTFNSNDVLGVIQSPRPGDTFRFGVIIGAGVYASDIRVDVTPEPSTLVLLTSGLIGILAYVWRKRK
jgi:hypothetical protein